MHTVQAYSDRFIERIQEAYEAAYIKRGKYPNALTLDEYSYNLLQLIVKKEQGQDITIQSFMGMNITWIPGTSTPIILCGFQA